MSKTHILDSWAILSYLEENSLTVECLEQLLEDASKGQQKLLMSWVNLGEIEYILRRREGDQEARETLDLLQFLPIEYVDVTPDRIHAAAKVKSEGGLSYADAFVVALSKEKEAQIVTGDPEIIETCSSDRCIDLS